jgi:DNA-binding MarR family transcriptional regulator
MWAWPSEPTPASRPKRRAASVSAGRSTTTVAVHSQPGCAGATRATATPEMAWMAGLAPPESVPAGVRASHAAIAMTLVYRDRSMARRSLRRFQATENRVLEFLRLLWAVDHQLQRASKRLTRDLGVTGPQRLAVRVIAMAPGLSPQEVAATLHLHKSTVTGIVQRLQHQGLIRRTVDESDKRRARLLLTPRGRRISNSRGPTIERAVQRALSGLPETAVDGASQVLTAIAGRLQADMGERRARTARSRVVLPSAQRSGGAGAAVARQTARSNARTRDPQHGGTD